MQTMVWGVEKSVQFRTRISDKGGQKKRGLASCFKSISGEEKKKGGAREKRSRGSPPGEKKGGKEEPECCKPVFKEKARSVFLYGTWAGKEKLCWTTPKANDIPKNAKGGEEVSTAALEGTRGGGVVWWRPKTACGGTQREKTKGTKGCRDVWAPKKRKGKNLSCSIVRGGGLGGKETSSRGGDSGRLEKKSRGKGGREKKGKNL